MEKEIRTRLEMELKKEVQGLKLKLTQVEEERIRDTERKKEEEKRQMMEELKELEIKKEMTTKAIGNHYLLQVYFLEFSLPHSLENFV